MQKSNLNIIISDTFFSIPTAGAATSGILEGSFGNDVPTCKVEVSCQITSK